MRSKSGLSRLKLTLLGVLLLGAAHVALASVKLPAIFSDHMVLQRDARVAVWGWADPGERVTVSIAGQTKTTQAGADGRWMLKLDKLKACDTPQQLLVKGVNTITVNDVLVGEVWLGSGQSNMALTVNRAKDYEQEQAAAKFPLIRMFKEESGTAKTALADGKGQWARCAPETVGAFSATLHFFGREIHQKLSAPPHARSLSRLPAVAAKPVSASFNPGIIFSYPLRPRGRSDMTKRAGSSARFATST